ncbi:MAG: NAD(P)-dependent oxidoreductase [Ignavibacterium sp.]|jgi:dTDP-4-dehydrorhamnose reductase|nr:NAD(P)-dependent oxidoreductase [Ignavibacterium sp.]
MKILISGGSGLLGQYLNISLSSKHNIFTIYNSNVGNCKDYNSLKLDICDHNSLLKIFNDFKPEIVIHTAAISQTILSDDISSKDVYNINVNSTKNIAELCDKFNSKLIYTSTDLVYAGYRGSMLKEDAKLIPVSLYAETKLMGELKIQHTFDNYIILRTALLFGFGINHSKNHFHQMYLDLQQGKPVNLFTNQFRTPLSLIEVSRIINELISSDIKSEVINFGGLERVSRYELGERLCEIAKFDKNLLTKITMDDVPGLQKVEDVSMNTDKLQSFGIKQKTLDEMILEIIK